MKYLIAIGVFALLLTAGSVEAQTVTTLPTYTRNPLTGNNVVKGGSYNPYTGNSVQYRQSSNAFTGNTRGSVQAHNGFTGTSTRATASYNNFTGTTRGRYVRR